jgi:hypothetical protein
MIVCSGLWELLTMGMPAGESNRKERRDAWWYPSRPVWYDVAVGPAVRRGYLPTPRPEGRRDHKSPDGVCFNVYKAESSRKLNAAAGSSGPDGDLGSNEILLSKDKTIASVPMLSGGGEDQDV